MEVRVRYVGPFAEGVELRLPDGRVVTVAPGQYITVPQDYAEGLLAQPVNWQAVEAGE